MREGELPGAGVSPAPSQLRGWRLLLARLGWLVLAGGAIVLFAVGVPARYADLRAQYQGTIQVQETADPQGVVYLWPAPGSPAVHAGLLSGDTLVAVNGVPVPPALTSAAAARALPPGIAGSAVILDVRTGSAPVRRYRLVWSGPLLFGSGLAPELVAGCSVAFDAGTLLLVTAIALLIVVRCAREWPALLASAMIVALYATVAYPTDIASTLHPAWRLAFQAWSVGSPLALCLFFYLFPNGQWLPRWSRVPVGVLTTASLVVDLAPGMPAWAHWASILCWLCGGVVAQAVRYGWHATCEERQQIVWVASGATAAFLGAVILTWLETGTGQPATFITGQPPGVAPPVDLLSPNGHMVIPAGAAALPYDLLVYPAGRLLLLLLPLAIAFTILRYRLWALDFMVNRALVYGALTVAVVGLYALGVTLLGAAFHTGNNALISAASTCAIALLFQPLRARLQRAVDRLMFGERDNPRGLLARLDQRLALALPAESVLPTIVETLATALRLPYAAITLVQTDPAAPGQQTAGAGERHERLAASFGGPHGATVELPLVYGAETVGVLHLAPRPGETRFSAADRRLLGELADHAGVVVHAARLTADLRRAREQLVAAREEERRRLRRDLHDGLGPHLASLTLTLGAARAYLAHDPVRADVLLGALAGHIQEAIADIRRVVYELRPPALDDLGLLGALADQASRFAEGTLQVRVEAEGPLPALPAAVEVAAYRICLEALTNVLRHASARTCVLSLRCAPALQVEIVDDGVGIGTAPRIGVGLRSVRERAEELGGWCTVQPRAEGGTRVAAWLPVQGGRG